MNLYEIDRNIQDILNSYIDEETGEINEKLFEELQQLQIEKSTKIDNIVMVIKNLKVFVDGATKEKKEIERKMKVADNQIERLKKYISESLAGEKFKSAKANIYYMTRESVQVADEIAFCEWAMNNGHKELLNIDIKPSLTQIGNYLNGGNTIDGVSKQANTSIVIR